MTMTIDAQRIPSQPVPTTVDVDEVLGVLRTAVDRAADLDPDRLSSGSAAGAALLALAEVARAASGAVGGEIGTSLRDAPGVVVVRDLMSAVSLAQRSASGHGGRGARVPAELVRRARGEHDRFLLLAADLA